MFSFDINSKDNWLCLVEMVGPYPSDELTYLRNNHPKDIEPSMLKRIDEVLSH